MSLKKEVIQQGDGDVTSAFRPIPAAPNDVEAINQVQSQLEFPHFSTEDIWAVGLLLRERLLSNPAPVVIAILLPGSPAPRILFYTATHTGTAPDNDKWVSRKAATVFRFGVPTWQMSVKFAQNERAFAEKYGLGPEEAGAYAIHGGAVPIRVRGVEGVVGCVVVSGLKQDQDHAVVVEVLEQYLKSL